MRRPRTGAAGALARKRERHAPSSADRLGPTRLINATVNRPISKARPRRRGFSSSSTSTAASRLRIRARGSVRAIDGLSAWGSMTLPMLVDFDLGVGLELRRLVSIRRIADRARHPGAALAATGQFPGPRPVRVVLARPADVPACHALNHWTERNFLREAEFPRRRFCGERTWIKCATSPSAASR